MTTPKQRIVDLQKSLRIARDALTKIQYGTSDAERVAEEAMAKIVKLEPKQQLQGIVGHADRRS